MAEKKMQGPAIKYSKNKLLTFAKYAKRVDLLGVLLVEGKEYTEAEVDAIIEKFMKGKVK